MTSRASRVAVFVPIFYQSAIYAASLIPAGEVVVHYPVFPREVANSIRMRNVHLYPNVRLAPLDVSLPPLDPVEIIGGSYSVDSLFKFKLDAGYLDGFDAIVTQELHTRYSAQISGLAERLGKPLIALTESDPSLSVLHIPPYAYYRRVVAGRARSFGSATVRSDEYLLSAGIRERVRLYVSAVDVEEFRPGADREDGMILFVGNLDRRKGFHTLVRALNALSRTHGRKFTAAFVGSGQLSGLLASAGFRFEHYDFLPEAELVRLYSRAPIFVMPSEDVHRYGLKIWTEVFGLAALEAMASGAAVVVSDSGNLPYAVRDERCVFPQGDHGALAGILARLLDDPGLARACGERNRKLAEEMFNKDVIRGNWRIALEMARR